MSFKSLSMLLGNRINYFPLHPPLVIKGVADAMDKSPASTPSDGSKKSSGIVEASFTVSKKLSTNRNSHQQTETIRKPQIDPLAVRRRRLQKINSLPLPTAPKRAPASQTASFTVLGKVLTIKVSFQRPGLVQVVTKRKLKKINQAIRRLLA